MNFDFEPKPLQQLLFFELLIKILSPIKLYDSAL